MVNITLKQFKNNDKLKASEVYYDTAHSILDIIFPIGRGFIDFTNTDYSNYLGFTWERELVGLTPVGLDTNQTEFDTIGKTGGEKTHLLANSEMPAHKHDYEGYINMSPQGGIDKNIIYGMPAGSSYATFSVSTTGGNQSHNNLQPYKVVAYWKRVA